MSNAYPFDTSRIQDAIDCGFTRQHVLDCLQIMHDSGQDTSNFNLLLDRCLHYQEHPKPIANANANGLHVTHVTQHSHETFTFTMTWHSNSNSNIITSHLISSHHITCVHICVVRTLQRYVLQ